MMCNNSELYSFVSKFTQLWNFGYEADLHIRCVNGYSFVNLQAGLGYAQTSKSNGKHGGKKSRNRRYEKRQMERKERDASTSTEDFSLNLDESETLADQTVTSNETNDIKLVEEIEIATEKEITVFDTHFVLESDIKNEIVGSKESIANTTGKQTVSEDEKLKDNPENKVTEGLSETSLASAETNLKTIENVTEEAKSIEKIAVPSVIELHAIVIFENSPHDIRK